MEFSEGCCYNFRMGSDDEDNLKMGDDAADDIVEAIKEEVIEAAKAIVADVKAIAHEVADTIAEGADHEHLFQPQDQGDSDAAPAAEEGDAPNRDDAAGGVASARKPS